MSLVEGYGQVQYCQREHRTLYDGSGTMVGKLDSSKGTKWPNILGCGHHPFFIVSQNIIDAWSNENLGTFPIHPFHIAPPIPKKLQQKEQPNYYWIDGKELRGALVDFEASGFVGVDFCPECGTRTENRSETFKRQSAKGARFSFVFREGTWNGLNLFTTDISDTLFFCTDAIVECAKKYGHTNFRFVPVEEGFGWA